jgi:hypothetical protein
MYRWNIWKHFVQRYHGTAFRNTDSPLKLITSDLRFTQGCSNWTWRLTVRQTLGQFDSLILYLFMTSFKNVPTSSSMISEVKSNAYRLTGVVIVGVPSLFRSGDPGFRSRPHHRLFWLKLFWYPHSLSWSSTWILKVGDDHFLPRHFQFRGYYFSCSTLHVLSWWKLC